MPFPAAFLAALHRAMEVKEQPAGGPQFVGKKDELIEVKRSFRTINGRDILVIHHQGVFYALDSYCYRKYGCTFGELTRCYYMRRSGPARY